MPPQLFDHDLILARRRRALAAESSDAWFLLNRVADDLVERLMAANRRFAVGVDIATPGPQLAERLAAAGQVDQVVRLDRLAESAARGLPFVAGDAEALPLAPASIDLAVSALALQFANDLPGVLIQIRRALRPDGLFLAALVGGESLTELRQALAAAEGDIRGGVAPRVAPLADLRDLGALLQRSGFALPVADSETVTVRYDSAFDLMRDLRAMGATNALIERERRPLRRDVLFRAAAIYGERFADPDGRVRATFQILSVSGWAPDPSQQQPLRPGSARQRLADALGATERSAGDKAEP